MKIHITIHSHDTAADAYLLAYKKWLEQQHVTGNTLRVYHSRVKQFLLFLEHTYPTGEPLTDLSKIPERMAFYLDFLKQSKGAAQSVNANINALNNFSLFLGLENIELKRERVYYKPPQILSLEEQDKFLRSVERQKSARDRALALVLFYTGLRIGECAWLNVADLLNTNDAFNSIKLSNGVEVSLNSQTQLALRQWLVERAKLVTIRSKAEKNALWLTRTGRRLSISGIAFVIKRIGWPIRLTVSAEILRRTWLSNATNRYSRTIQY